MQPGLMAPAAGVSEALTVAPCRVALASTLCQFHGAGARRRVWSTGDWEAVGEHGSRQKPLLVQVSASPCICPVSALHVFTAFHIDISVSIPG